MGVVATSDLAAGSPGPGAPTAPLAMARRSAPTGIPSRTRPNFSVAENAPADHLSTPLAAHVRQLFQEAKQHRAPLVRRWIRNYNVLHNRTWGRRDPWMSSPEIPEMWPIVAAQVGWMTDQRPEFEVTPFAANFTAGYGFQRDLADDLNTTLQANWRANSTDAAIEQVLWDASVYGIGWGKAIWDPKLVGGLGDAVLRRCDPFTIYVDPRASSVEDANYIIEAKRESIQSLDRRFPGAGKRLLNQSWLEDTDRAPDTIKAGGQHVRATLAPNAMGGRTTPSGAVPAGNMASLTFDEGVTVYEAWLRDHTYDAKANMLVDTWRCVVVAGNQVLMDTPATDIWSHGLHPYDRMVMIETGEMYGQSLVELLTPAQVSINMILSSIEQHIRLTGNPVFKENARAGLQRSAMTNKPGSRLTLNDGGTAEWLQPPRLDYQLFQIINFYKGEMENISGLSAITRGFMPTGRNSQGVVESVQESGFVRVRLALRNLERWLEKQGDKMAALIVEFYDAPRMVATVGPTGESSSLALRSLHWWLPTAEGRTPMRYQFNITAGSALPTNKSALEQLAMQLYTAGAIDREALMTTVRFPHAERVEARMRAREASQGTIEQPPNMRPRQS